MKEKATLLAAAIVVGGVMTVLVVLAIGWHVRELREWQN